MNSTQIEQVKKILSNNQTAEEKAGLAACKESVMLAKFAEHHKNTHAQGGTTGNDSEEENDDEEGGHGPGVGCQQQ